jgi:hypothetical protein
MHAPGAAFVCCHDQVELAADRQIEQPCVVAKLGGGPDLNIDQPGQQLSGEVLGARADPDPSPLTSEVAGFEPTDDRLTLAERFGDNGVELTRASRWVDPPPAADEQRLPDSALARSELVADGPLRQGSLCRSGPQRTGAIDRQERAQPFGLSYRK